MIHALNRVCEKAHFEYRCFPTCCLCCCVLQSFSLSFLSAPSFVEELTDQTIALGQSVTLSCRTSTHSSPRIEWFKGDANRLFQLAAWAYSPCHSRLPIRDPTSQWQAASVFIRFCLPSPSTNSSPPCRAGLGVWGGQAGMFLSQP